MGLCGPVSCPWLEDFHGHADTSRGDLVFFWLRSGVRMRRKALPWLSPSKLQTEGEPGERSKAKELIHCMLLQGDVGTTPLIAMDRHWCKTNVTQQ